MSSFHGETNDFVVLYSLAHLKSVVTGNNNSIGLFRNGGLVLVSKISTRLIEILTKR